ncbi:MAG: hypothetical protein AAFZ18_24250, partial [Myxococcota bacterium]
MEVPLRFGENPYQKAGFQPERTTDPLALQSLRVMAGSRSMTFEEMVGLDVGIDALARTVESLRPNQKGHPQVAVVVKHGNPVGIGLDAHEPAVAADRALSGFSAASSEGVFVCNFPLTPEVGELKAARPTIVAAPALEGLDDGWLSDGALALRSPALEWPSLDRAVGRRAVRGGHSGAGDLKARAPSESHPSSRPSRAGAATIVGLAA